MLVKTIYNAEQLREEFRSMNRDYFSYEGYEALINLFEECDNGNPTELDVVAICCDFTEASMDEILMDYNYLWEEYVEEYIGDLNEIELDEDELKEAFENFLNYHTWAIETTPGNYLYQNF